MFSAHLTPYSDASSTLHTRLVHKRGVNTLARERLDLLREHIWAAVNGDVANGGLRGVWPPFLEIGLFRRLFRPFSDNFRPFPEGLQSTWEIQKTQRKRPFSSDVLGFG